MRLPQTRNASNDFEALTVNYGRTAYSRVVVVTLKIIDRTVGDTPRECKLKVALIFLAVEIHSGP